MSEKTPNPMKGSDGGVLRRKNVIELYVIVKHARKTKNAASFRLRTLLSESVF